MILWPFGELDESDEETEEAHQVLHLHLLVTLMKFTILEFNSRIVRSGLPSPQADQPNRTSMISSGASSDSSPLSSTLPIPSLTPSLGRQGLTPGRPIYRTTGTRMVTEDPSAPSR